jgi:glutamine synthetase
MIDEEAKRVLSRVEEEGVRFFRLQFTDIFGIPKNVEIPSEKLEAVFEKGIAFDGSSIEGFMRISESDMYLRPDPSTFVIYPWSVEGRDTKTARLVCDVLKPDGSPFEGDPRYALKQAVAEAAKLGYTMYAGAEAEFFLFRRTQEGRPSVELHDRGGYFDLIPVDLGEELRKEIVVALEQMGFEVEAAHHEVAPSQHEIDFRYAEVLRTADNIVTFRFVVKTIAQLRGLHATFMPKPIAGINGNGMHTHLSLFRNGTNAFYDPDDPYQLSQAARQFLAGVIEHIGAITALANPTVNSYKRLVPGYEAPVNISWGRINRSALIRVPASNTPETSTRLELRSPDPSANPYLLYAAILMSGLDGIQRELTPPEPIEENIYELSSEERTRRDIGTLPADLGEALAALEGDEVVREALGPHIFEKYLEAKRRELEEYRLAVSPWEVERYLEYY